MTPWGLFWYIVAAGGAIAVLALVFRIAGLVISILDEWRD